MSDELYVEEIPVQVERKGPLNYLVAAVLALCIVVATLSFTSFYFARLSASAFQETYENRSVECRAAIRVGVELDRKGPCYDPKVLAYYDPESIEPIISEAQIERIGNLFCLMLAQQGVNTEECIEADE